MEMRKILDTKYWVSRCGTRFWNEETDRDLSITIRKDGYRYVTLVKTEYMGEWRYQRPVGLHRLVALAWLDIPSDWQNMDIDHLDYDKGNNDADNLQWVTHKENCKRRSAVMGHPSGKDHWNYGRVVGKVTRRRMSDVKKGENHPKFRGWYSVEGVWYASSYEAGAALGISHKTVIRRVRDPRYTRWVFIEN